MPYDKFLIADIKSGLQTDKRPWIIPDDAFAQLINAYTFRGRVRKRFGARPTLPTALVGPSQLGTRVRVQVGTIGAPVSPVPGSVFQPGQMFSAADQIFTVTTIGTPAAMLSTGVGTGTFNTTTGAFALAGTGLPGATPIYFYPSQPIMGIGLYQTGAINDQPTYVFDTQFAYQFTSTGWSRLGTRTWTGSNSQFFWMHNHTGNLGTQSLLFVTNNNAADGMAYWDGANWTTFVPPTDGAGGTVTTALIIIGFQGRLLLLNTTEGGVNYPWRVRWSVDGDPTLTTAFYSAQNNTGIYGGYRDNIATQERIVSAQLIRNRLIVFYERSTWELVYQGTQIDPFRWQQINIELGSQSSFSTVPFDKALLTVGNVGVHACNGSNVERIDSKIPDFIFQLQQDNDGARRVVGARDFIPEMVYWTYATDANEFSLIYPNRVLVYNYQNLTWSINEDCITFMGPFYGQSDLTWSDAEITWGEAIQQWNAGINTSRNPLILAGNQVGYVFVIDTDSGRNSYGLQITQITNATNTITAYNHNLELGQFVWIENLVPSNMNINNTIQKVMAITDANNFVITVPFGGITGTYLGGGTITKVLRPDIVTKPFNPYDSKDRNVYISKVAFNVDATAHGQVIVNYYASFADPEMTFEAGVSGSLLGTGVLETTPYDLYPLEKTASQLWHTIYLESEGEAIQIEITMNDEQMMDVDIVQEDFELNAMLLTTQPTSRLQ